MKQAHHGVLVIKGTGLHNGTAQHFHQAAANGIQNDAQDHTDERITQHLRQKSQSGQSQRRGDLRPDNRPAVANLVYIPGAESVHDQLRQKNAVGISAICPRLIW